MSAPVRSVHFSSPPPVSEPRPAFPGAPRSAVVAIGASMGGVTALREVLGALPAGLPAAVLVVQHLEPNRPSVLARILDRCGPLAVAQAAGGETIEAGRVYVAPPGRHLVLEPGGRLALSDAPRVRYSRPSADTLFLSVAEHAPGAVVAVVLTGFQSDGSGGVDAVRARGGTVIAQDEATSRAFGMPGSAIATGAVHHVLPLAEIAPMIVRLVRER